jgi:hypothetical protein
MPQNHPHGTRWRDRGGVGDPAQWSTLLSPEERCGIPWRMTSVIFAPFSPAGILFPSDLELLDNPMTNSFAAGFSWVALHWWILLIAGAVGIAATCRWYRQPQGSGGKSNLIELTREEWEARKRWKMFRVISA